MIVAPIEEFKKVMWARFEEIGRDKWPRAVLTLMREQKLETVEELTELCERGSLEDRSARKESKKNHKDGLIWFKEEKERLEARIRGCEAEKLRSETLMRRTQMAVEEERKTAEELSGSLTKELEKLKKYMAERTNVSVVEKVDTTKKARKAKMVEPEEILSQRRQFEIDSGSVVLVISTGGWERSKKRSSKWEKEVKVLSKPNFSGPPQRGAQVRAKAKTGLG
uniref:Uncharacterized protein n=1 Tax=Caenorhabditis japonica TaxID=281687 RepID=A0A8R1EK61_CAEJA